MDLFSDDKVSARDGADDMNEQAVENGFKGFPRLDTPDSGISNPSTHAEIIKNGSKRIRKIEEKWLELLTVNGNITVDVMQLQQEVGTVKNTLRSVSAEFKESCSLIMAELQDRRAVMALRVTTPCSASEGTIAVTQQLQRI